MKYLLVLMLMTLSMGCSKSKEYDLISGPKGDKGEQGNIGPSGANGHSIVSQYTEACGYECSSGGTRLDLYLDMDDSLSLTESDSYTGSLVVCNGSNGLNGEQGLQGATGATGSTGAQGLVGATGPAGAVGPQGNTGATGLAGANGLPGPVGPQGPSGPAGAQGPQGPAGTTATITTYTNAACTLITGTSYYVKPNGGNAGIYTANTCASNTKVAEVGEQDSFWVATNMLAVDYGTDGVRVIKFN